MSRNITNPLHLHLRFWNLYDIIVQMTGDVVSIENVNIGNVFIAPEVIPDDLTAFLREQIAARVHTLIGEGGYPVAEEADLPDGPSTAEELAELEQAEADVYEVRARASHLRNVASHVASARRLEGFQTNHEHAPRKRSAVEKKQSRELTKAEVSLKRACGQCVFRGDCKLAGDIERWIDVHPYADDNTGRRRPGSSEVREVESRKAFLESLAVGVARRQQVHCDPARRK